MKFTTVFSLNEPALANEISLPRASQTEPQAQVTIQDFVGTIMVYKFPQLSRQELEAMLELGSIKKTRVYQEALEEGESIGEVRGILKGEIEGERNALIWMLTRKFGPLPQEVSQWLNSVDSKAELEQLMNRAFDATSLEDFWVR